MRRCATASISTFRPSNFSIDVTPLPRRPQGTMCSKYRKSVFTLNANPCEVTHRETCTPMATNFSLPTQTPMTRKVQDGVAHQLSRAVIGDIPASVRLEDLRSYLGEELPRDQQVFLLGVPAERVD